MKRQGIWFLLILFAAGCNKAPSSLSAAIPMQPGQTSQLCLHIVSEPAGASVDVDGHYEGKTPLVWMAPKEKYKTKPIAIVAHPISGDKQSQKKVLHPSHEMPQIVYFDMLRSR